jgi:ABC-type lipoprotein release transport system permease subunit
VPHDAEHATSGWREIAQSGVDAVALHPVRNAVTALCLVALLVPYIAGVAVARGLADAAEDAIANGADVYVRAERFGVSVPVPSAVSDALAEVEGIESCDARIVSPIVIGKDAEPVLLVGLAAAVVPLGETELRGRLFQPGSSHEVVVGSTLAAALGLDVGARLPPFYRSARGERVATVVGIFADTASPWLGRMMFTDLATAAWIADEEHAVSQVLVRCDSSDAKRVARAIETLPLTGLAPAGTGMRLEATTRDDLEFLLPRTLFHREAALHLLFVLVFAVGVPLVLVSSGLGQHARRQETGLLRATGWRIDEVLARAVIENVTVALGSAAAAILVAWFWLEVLGGALLGAVFLRGDAALAASVLPYRLTPGPALLGAAVALAIVLTGSISATWRTASASPARTMA